MGTFRWVNEDSIAGAVGRLDVDIGLDNRTFLAQRRGRSSGKASCEGERDELAPR